MEGGWVALGEPDFRNIIPENGVIWKAKYTNLGSGSIIFLLALAAGVDLLFSIAIK